jgi:hypothetical protein
LAETISEWSPSVVPGLLQTEAYHRAVIRATHPHDLPEDVDVKVAARLERAELLDDQTRPEYWVVLSEFILRQPIAGTDVMATQFAHIAELARTRPRFIPQILPLNAGAHPFILSGLAKIMTFPDAPPLVYTEGVHHGQLADDPTLVRKYLKSYDFLRAAALPPKASLAMIEAAAEEFRNDHEHRPEPRHLAQELPQQRGRRELPGGG